MTSGEPNDSTKKDGPPRRAGGKRQRGRERDEREESKVKTRTLKAKGAAPGAAQGWGTRLSAKHLGLPPANLQNSSAEFLQKSPFKSELAKLLGEALLKTRSALWLSLGQLCRLPRAAEHASRSCGDLHGAPVQNLVVPINDCQQRMPHNAHLRIGFISCR